MVYQPKRETITIRSSIKPKLLHVALKRGGMIGTAGALLIILGGTFLPINLLKIWGIPIFFGGLALIAIGFFPYRKLHCLELKPNELSYDGEMFLFLKQGKPLFKIPKTSIAKIGYIEKNNLYGLAIWLKYPIGEKVHVLQSSFANFFG